MTRLILTSAFLGGILVGLATWSLRGVGAACADDHLVEAPAVSETSAQLLAASVAGCAAGGGTWSQGLEDGVVVGRCYPVPSLGTLPAVSRRVSP